MFMYPFNSSLARMSVIATVSTYRRISDQLITVHVFQLIGGKFLGSKKEKSIRVLVKGAPEAIKPLLNVVSLCMPCFIPFITVFSC